MSGGRGGWLRALYRGLLLFSALFAVLSGALTAMPGAARADEGAIDATAKSGILKVAVYKDFFPFSDARDGGIDVDIAQALADALGLKLSLLPFDAGEQINDDLRNMVWKGHYLGYGPADVMMHVPSDPMLARQNDKVSIFGAYQVESVALCVNRERIPDWQGLEVFTREKIAVDGGSFSAQIILMADGGRYKDNVLIRPNVRAALEELKSGKAAAVMATRSELQAGGGAKAPYSLVDANFPGAPLRSWAVGIAVKSERQELAAKLAAAMKQLQVSGSIAAIFERHGVRNVQP
jgi:ABC-type amino acid transport substrate-binding protein